MQTAVNCKPDILTGILLKQMGHSRPRKTKYQGQNDGSLCTIDRSSDDFVSYRKQSYSSTTPRMQTSRVIFIQTKTNYQNLIWGTAKTYISLPSPTAPHPFEVQFHDSSCNVASSFRMATFGIQILNGITSSPLSIAANFLDMSTNRSEFNKTFQRCAGNQSVKSVEARQLQTAN